MREDFEVLEEISIRIHGRRTDEGRQRHELLVDHRAEPIRVGQTDVVSSAERVDDSGVGAPLLIGHTDVDGGPLCDFAHRRVVLERLRPMMVALRFGSSAISSRPGWM